MEDGFHIFQTDNLEKENSEIDRVKLIAKFTNCLKIILKKRFPDDHIKADLGKQTSNSKIIIACPYCGDSKRRSSYKRGKLYLRNLHYICYNGGCHKSKAFIEFLEDYNQKDYFTFSELEYIKRNHYMLRMEGDNKNLREVSHITGIIGLDRYGIPRGDIMRELRLVNVEDNTACLNYLRGRKQIQNDNRHFAYNPYYEDLCIFNLSGDRKRVISFQIRLSKTSKRGARFLTKSYSQIWEDVFDVTNLKKDIAEKMDKLGNIYVFVRHKLFIT